MTLKDFRNILFLVLTSVVITVIIPGIFSSVGGTFYATDIKSKISKSEFDKLTEFDNHIAYLDTQIQRVDNKINTYLTDTEKKSAFTIDELIKLKDKLLFEKQNAKPPLSLIPYYLNPQMLLWLGIYAAFFLLIYLLLAEQKIKILFTRKLFSFSILVYIFYEWPLWLRNFVLTNKGRTVYAYPNFDIDKYSYFCQEFIIYFFCLLATILITVSLQLYNSKIKVKTEENDTNKFLILSSYYSTAYRNWFIHSTILALGFLSFTGFFWRLVFAYGDQRYVISALNAHVLWALCWVAISLNLLRYMQQFDKTRRDILRSNPDDKTLKIVMEHQPANNMTLIISGIASLVTFLLPMLKTLLQ